jgi:hypothetical protein
VFYVRKKYALMLIIYLKSSRSIKLDKMEGLENKSGHMQNTNIMGKEESDP